MNWVSSMLASNRATVMANRCPRCLLNVFSASLGPPSSYRDDLEQSQEFSALSVVTMRRTAVAVAFSSTMTGKCCAGQGEWRGASSFVVGKRKGLW